jgi:hypothetical protein
LKRSLFCPLQSNKHQCVSLQYHNFLCVTYIFLKVNRTAGLQPASNVRPGWLGKWSQ